MCSNINEAISSDFVYQFQIQNELYFKNKYTDYLDEGLGDLNGQIIDLEQQILIQIEDNLINDSDFLLDLNDYLSEFDCVFALF